MILVVVIILGIRGIACVLRVLFVAKCEVCAVRQGVQRPVCYGEAAQNAHQNGSRVRREFQFLLRRNTLQPWHESMLASGRPYACVLEEFHYGGRVDQSLRESPVFECDVDICMEDADFRWCDLACRPHRWSAFSAYENNSPWDTQESLKKTPRTRWMWQRLSFLHLTDMRLVLKIHEVYRARTIHTSLSMIVDIWSTERMCMIKALYLITLHVRVLAKCYSERYIHTERETTNEWTDRRLPIWGRIPARSHQLMGLVQS